MSEPDPAQSLLTQSQSRLQRPPDFTGRRLNSFRQVFLRHGMPGALLGALVLLHPNVRVLGERGLEPFLANPVRYLVIAAVILIALSIYACYIDRGWRAKQLGWIVYLGALSLWEEWVFRLAIPYYLDMQGVALWSAVLFTNLAFGVIHYFTLRWRWYWCVAAFLGGIALSRPMDTHFDLLLITGFHWIGTFLNTPRSPS